MPIGYDKNPYAILGVPNSATEQEIKDAFRRLARQVHPDVNKEPHAAERMKDVNWAYSILGDASERSRYDFWRRGVYVDPTPRPNPPPSSRAGAPTSRNDPWREVKKTRSSGWSGLGILWLIMMLINTLTRAGRQSYDPAPLNVGNAQTMDAMLQEIDSRLATETALAAPTILPTNTPSPAELNAALTATAEAFMYVDIRAQVMPGTVEWEWFTTLLADYPLTTADGLSDEVTRVRRNLITGDIMIETRQYGAFVIYVTSRQEVTVIRLSVTPMP